MNNEEVNFLVSEPVWPVGKEKEMNMTVGFRAQFNRGEDSKITLRIVASSLYRFFINGKFVGHGPARGPHGYYRVDEWVINTDFLEDINVIAIEVVGYNVNSFYTLDQPSFLQAELSVGETPIVATNSVNNGFEVTVLKERIQKVQRYSFQRTFVEAYVMEPGYDKWRVDMSVIPKSEKCISSGKKALISRGVPYPEFKKQIPVLEVSKGLFRAGQVSNELSRSRTLDGVGPKFKGYKEDELKIILSYEMDRMSTISNEKINHKYIENYLISLTDECYEILDFGINNTGFIGIKVKCTQDTRLLLIFDEILLDEDVNYKRMDCVNVISYELKVGEYELESFEPFTLRYLKLMVIKGACDISSIYLRELTNPNTFGAKFKSPLPELNSIFEAARQTFKQNAVDIYMDCPSRERAGWLCDSFFTSRVEYDLTGKTAIEDNFFQNYLLPDGFKCIPQGMLPMCYPADHYDGVFIPNWALWFVLELEEYLNRSGNIEIVSALKPKVMGLFKYLNNFKNEYGLLERLEGWIFIEWSKANDFMMDVNYPTNMLYAAALKAAGRIYEDTRLMDEGESIHEVIRRLSFNGKFFVDNAIRKDGKLTATDNKSEVCQYYAFVFGTASPSTHGELLETLIEKFGPTRDDEKVFPQVYIANAFIGNYLRMELLSSMGYSERLINETKDLFTYMVDRTGTLWEHKGAYASCNHGFASHVIHCYYRDILGIWKLDSKNKRVVLRFNNISLDWCEGKIPVDVGFIYLKWEFTDEEIKYHIEVPKGYTVEVINLTNKKLHVN